MTKCFSLFYGNGFILSFFYYRQYFYRSFYVTWWVSYEKQEQLTIRGQLEPPPFCFGGIHVIQLFSFKCSIVFYLFCLPLFCVLCPAFSVSLDCSNFVPSFWFSLTLTKCFRCINNHIFALNNFHGYTSLVLTLRRYHMTIYVSGYRV